MLQRSPAIEVPTSACGGSPLAGLAVDAARLLPAIGVLVGGMAAACGGVLAVRRLVGAIGTPGPDAVLAVCGAGLLLVAIGDRVARSLPQSLALGGIRSPGRPRIAVVVAVLTRLGLLLAVAATGLPPRTATPIDVGAMLVAFAVCLAAIVRGPVAAIAAGPTPFGPAADPPGLPAMPTPLPGLPAIEPADGLPPGHHVQQRFERLSLPDGIECVRGRLVVVVPEGSRSGFGHVGFCPPLASPPTVDVSTDYDGVEAVVSAAEVLPWGARIECRLDEPAEETIDIPVDFLAKAPA